MTTRKFALMVAVLATLVLPPAVRQCGAEDVDEMQNLIAQRWMEAFKRLDTRNNITMVLSNRDSLYELENVVEIEAFTRFLIVRCELVEGGSFRALVYPGTILLIKEDPRGKASRKASPSG